MKSKNNKKIYISDLDGTLVDNDGIPSKYTKRKLIELLDKGVNITVASARSIISIREVLRDVPLRLPVIEINGAFISELTTGKHLIINDMDKETIESIYSIAMKHNSFPFISTFNGDTDCLYYNHITNEGLDWYHNNRTENKDKRLRHTRSLESTFCDNVVAFTLINTYEKLNPLAIEIQSRFAGSLQTFFFENYYSPSWWWLTIHDKKACKAQAIKTLVDYAGFDMKNLTVFGDNLNDVNMFKMAPRAIAVENATDEIKKHATHTIGPNHTDSVIKYIANESR